MARGFTLDQGNPVRFAFRSAAAALLAAAIGLAAAVISAQPVDGLRPALDHIILVLLGGEVPTHREGLQHKNNVIRESARLLKRAGYIVEHIVEEWVDGSSMSHVKHCPICNEAARRLGPRHNVPMLRPFFKGRRWNLCGAYYITDLQGRLYRVTGADESAPPTGSMLFKIGEGAFYGYDSSGVRCPAIALW